MVTQFPHPFLIDYCQLLYSILERSFIVVSFAQTFLEGCLFNVNRADAQQFYKLNSEAHTTCNGEFPVADQDNTLTSQSWTSVPQHIHHSMHGSAELL